VGLRAGLSAKAGKCRVCRVNERATAPERIDPLTEQRLDAWLLSDGHAGNVRQVQALAQAIGWPAQEWIVRARAPWRWLAPRELPGARAAFGDAFAQALDHRDLDRVLAIGCGRQAALATRLLHGRGARAVQILDPRVATDHWDLVIAPEHDGLRGENVITLQGSLHPVDDAWLDRARLEFPGFAQLPGPRTALLLGGPSAHARLDEAFFADLLRQLGVAVRSDGGSVLATASRRTPAAAAAEMQATLSSLPGVCWRGAQDGANPYAGLLGWADRIVCTADSVNLLSEAAATGAPLYIAGIDRLDGRPRRFVEALLGSGRARPFTGTFDADSGGATVRPLRETARVAAQVRARLGLARVDTG
jgi:mitochondrial fission protein ELM1